jgi:hypothetical protein
VANIIPYASLFGVALGANFLNGVTGLDSMRSNTGSAILAGTTEVIDFDIMYGMDGAGRHMVEIAFADVAGLANAMVIASGGVDGTLGIEPCVTGFSLDGGLTFDSYKWLERPQRSIVAQTPTLIEDGSNLYVGYAVAGIDRVTFRLTTLDDVFNAYPGQIKIFAPEDSFGNITGDNGLILPTSGTVNGRTYSNIPYVKGIYQTVPGRPDWLGKAICQFHPVLDDTPLSQDGALTVATLPVTFDLWGDYIMKATQTLVQRVAGLYFAYDSTDRLNPDGSTRRGIYPGSRGHFVADPSDGPLNITGRDKGIAIGFVGKSKNGIGGVGGEVVEKIHMNFRPLNQGGKDWDAQGFAEGLSHTDETIEGIISDSFVVDPVIQDQYGQAEFTAGSNNLGLPQQAAITGICCVNRNPLPHDDGSIFTQYTYPGQPNPPGSDGNPARVIDQTAWNWQNCVPVISMGTQTGNVGGLFYTPGDNIFHRLSQQMSVNYMTYDEELNIIFVANDFGVYYLSLNPTEITPTGWPTIPAGHPLGTEIPSSPGKVGSGLANPKLNRLGSLVRHVVKVITSKGDNGITYVMAHSQGSGNGGDGIFCYPCIPGDQTADVGYGYDLTTGAVSDTWSRIQALETVVDFTAYKGLQYLYFINSQTDVNNQGAWVTIVYNAGSTSTDMPPVGKAKIHDFGRASLITFEHDGKSPNIFLTTAAGSARFYRIQAGTKNVFDANADRTLKDLDGLPVQVNHIVHYGVYANDALGISENLTPSINGHNVALLACTDHGLFYTSSLTGGQWQPTNGQSGLETTNIVWASGGLGQPILQHKVYRVFASDGQNFYQSNNGGIWWTNVTAASLDLAPFFYGLYQELVPLSTFPHNNITVLSSSQGSTTTFAPGDFETITAGNAYDLPKDFQWARRLDEHNDWTYRLIDTRSNAPFFGIMFSQVNSLQGSLQVPPIVASQQLAIVTMRWLMEATKNFSTITIESQFTQDNAALRTLRPTMQVTVEYSGFIARFVTVSGDLVAQGMHYVNYKKTPFYVISHELKSAQSSGGAAGVVFTETKLGSTLVQSTQDPNALAADMQYALKSVKKYGV